MPLAAVGAHERDRRQLEPSCAFGIHEDDLSVVDLDGAKRLVPDQKLPVHVLGRLRIAKNDRLVQRRLLERSHDVGVAVHVVVHDMTIVRYLRR